MGKFVVSKRTNGDYQFNLIAGNGQVILSSQGYSAKTGCENGIASVKKNATDDARYDRQTATNGKLYFNLKSTNGQIIGSSQMYTDTSGMENGIASVMQNAPEASVEEKS